MKLYYLLFLSLLCLTVHANLNEELSSLNPTQTWVECINNPDSYWCSLGLEDKEGICCDANISNEECLQSQDNYQDYLCSNTVDLDSNFENEFMHSSAWSKYLLCPYSIEFWGNTEPMMLYDDEYKRRRYVTEYMPKNLVCKYKIVFVKGKDDEDTSADESETDTEDESEEESSDDESYSENEIFEYGISLYDTRNAKVDLYEHRVKNNRVVHINTLQPPESEIRGESMVNKGRTFFVLVEPKGDDALAEFEVEIERYHKNVGNEVKKESVGIFGIVILACWSIGCTAVTIFLACLGIKKLWVKKEKMGVGRAEVMDIPQGKVVHGFFPGIQENRKNYQIQGVHRQFESESDSIEARPSIV